MQLNLPDILTESRLYSSYILFGVWLHDVSDIGLGPGGND